MPNLEDQQVWRASLGLDLADRTVLEAEVLIWRILRQKSTTLRQHSLNQEETTLHLTNRGRIVVRFHRPHQGDDPSNKRPTEEKVQKKDG